MPMRRPRPVIQIPRKTFFVRRGRSSWKSEPLADAVSTGTDVLARVASFVWPFISASPPNMDNHQ